MDKRELTKRLMTTYLDELDEHVRTLNRDLLALEKDPAAEQREKLIQSLFRAAHSLKGASRAVDIELIEQVCHVLEDLLASVRDSHRALGSDLFAMLFKAADAIEEAGMRLREEQTLDEAPLVQLLPVLKEFERGAAAGLGIDVPVGEPATTARTLPPDTAVVEPPAGQTVKPEQGVVPRQFVSSAKTTVRVAAEKLDSLLAQAGELLVARQRLELRVDELESLRDAVATWRRQWRRRTSAPLEPSSMEATDAHESLLQTALLFERELDHLVSRARDDVQYLGQVGSAIEDDVHRARMLPFAQACDGLERAVRDVAESSGKRVQLELRGGDVQVDRSVLEGAKDPLLHLVRNSVDHGVELPSQRREAGKSEQATIVVAAVLRGANVEISVRDDGCGLDLARIAARARQQDMDVPQDPAELARLIFLPAFSTATEITGVSGRGVGLDVVRSQIEHLHGTVDVAFQPGVGTEFILTVPLTLTTIRAILVKAAGQTFAFPTNNVERIVRFDASQHATIGGRSVLLLDESPLSLTGLARTLGFAQQWTLDPAAKMLAVILKSGGQRVAFAVDEITAEAELTVKSLGPRVRRLLHVSGATLLPTGDIALVLNSANLIRTAAGTGGRLTVAVKETPAAPRKKRLLVVDDSVTSRTLLRSILEAAGYDVAVAADGRQALDMATNRLFDLIVSDVDMPRLNGFELTAALRQTSTAQQLPVVLVTARGGNDDRTLGVQAGANAYIIKSGFDQTELLNVISELL